MTPAEIAKLATLYPTSLARRPARLRAVMPSASTLLRWARQERQARGLEPRGRGRPQMPNPSPETIRIRMFREAQKAAAKAAKRKRARRRRAA